MASVMVYKKKSEASTVVIAEDDSWLVIVGIAEDDPWLVIGAKVEVYADGFLFGESEVPDHIAQFWRDCQKAALVCGGHGNGAVRGEDVMIAEEATVERSKRTGVGNI